MSIDHLSQLPVDVFIKEITYLPFDDVISVCQTNKTLHNYCTNSSYNNKWRQLIDDTFGNIYDYQNKLNQVRNKLNLNDGVYNYLIYTQLVKLLDPVTQLMIYYRQGDTKFFDSSQYNNIQQFLALFLLGEKNEMMKYLPSDTYLPFISMLKGNKIDQNILDIMLLEMVKEGSMKGISVMLSKGANINVTRTLQRAKYIRYLEVVKYLVDLGAPIHALNSAMIISSSYGNLPVVKYLTEKGANIHDGNDDALRWASENGHLEVVKYLVERGANVHADYDWALRSASREGYLEVVRYLVENGADVHARDDYALRLASQNIHLEVVKYLKSLN